MRKQELHPRTAVINKTQKNKSKKARHDALVWLAANFPAAFDNSLRIRPLKIGIMDDILLRADEAVQVGISRSKLREAVVLFTRRLDYLACLKAREMRIDLDGHLITEVSEEEAEHAALKIKKKVEKSVRNSRKTLAGKALIQTNASPHGSTYPAKQALQAVSTALNPADDVFPVYPARSNAFIPSSPVSQATKTAVVVKHKTTKPYDPDAVARLKEKLGLSRAHSEKDTVSE